jgi:fimbrial isopeptide formation D2 family protein
MFTLDASASIQDTLEGTVSILPSSTDVTLENNSIITSNPITGSYDPNDKTASPEGDTPPDSWIEFIVRFQNTGNDTAFTVRILDTLSTHLNLATLNILGHSHPVRYTLNGNMLEFTFDDILLPDSTTNEPLSQGYISYKLRVKSGLSLNTQIPNTAYIYFDFNEPIITNTTVNTITWPSTIDELGGSAVLSLFPNPSQGHFVVEFSNSVPGEYQLQVSDLSGRVILNQEFMHTGRTALRTELQVMPGVYLLYVEGQGRKTVGKTVIY